MAKVLLVVLYKKGARDPEGETLARELRELGYTKVRGLRAGKALLFDVEDDDAEKEVLDMARRTRLFNPSVHEPLVLKVG